MGSIQQIHVRSLFSLLVGTAVRDGSLYSANSRNQTAALNPVLVSKSAIEAKITVTEAMRTWAARLERTIDQD
jgi:hypothetical protein